MLKIFRRTTTLSRSVKPIMGATRQYSQLAKQSVCSNKQFYTVSKMGFSSANPDMIEMKDSADWDSYLESDTPIILQAGASWCGPCNMLKPLLKKASGEFGDKVDFVYMDIDKFPEIAEMLEIQHIPKTFMIYKGELVDQFGGVPQDG